MSLENYPKFVLNLSEDELNGEDKHFYQFKSFRLSVEERLLLNNNVKVSLTPKAFDVLAFLVERSGHLVEKDDLLKTIWADSFVEETNITRIIHTLRKNLGENESGNKFIETVAKKGYRFVAEVTEIYESPVPKPVNGNGKSSIEANNLSASESAEKTDEAKLQILPAGDERRLASTPKQKTRIILFSIGFISAAFLLFLLSFNFRSGLTFNTGKARSIAVLPVKPINTTVRDELFELGIADSLIYRLNTTKNFIVRPLSVTRQYTDLAQDPIAAGREQKTDYVFSANYQLADGKIRITGQLINVATGQIEETYKSEKDAGSVFAAEDAIANEVGNLLFSRFAAIPNKTTLKRGTANDEAYRLYLQGRNLTAKRSQADIPKAVEYFEQAVRLDPNFALGYVGMAHSYLSSGNLKAGKAREAYKNARIALNQAVELGADSADVYETQGELKFFYEWDFAGAEKDLAKAIELEPNNDSAHWNYSILLNHQGRFEESFAELEIALAINPNSLAYQRERGRFSFFARRYDEAILHLERVLEIDPNFGTAYGWIWRSYELKGDYAGAFEWFIKHQKLINPDRTGEYQKAYETGDWQNVRRKMLEFEKLDEQKIENYFQIARLSALLGEKEQAFEYLNKALEGRQSQMVMLKVEPAFDSLRDDPRFDALLRRVGFK